MSSRPWREKPRSSASAPGPLVPTSAVSATTQRLVVTAVFFVLQGAKLAARRSFASFVLYSALDAVFTFALPVLAVPRLNFKQRVLLSQVFLLTLLNYSLFMSTAWIRTLLWLAATPLLSALGLTGKNGAAFSDGLISGKYVVDILPEASATLDTIAPLCIHPQRQDPVFLRLTLENSWPSGISLGRAELGSDELYSRQSFSKREITKMPADRPKSQLYVPVTKPGAYYLDAIVDDRTGLRVKALRNRLVIPPCPSVELVSLSDDVLCKSDIFRAEATLSGVAPFKVLADDGWKTVGEELPHDGVSTESLMLVREHGSRVEIQKIEDKLGVTLDVEKQVSARVIGPSVATVPGSQVLAKVDAMVAAKFHVSGDKADAPFKLRFRKPGDAGVLDLQVNEPGLHQFTVADVGTYVLESLTGSKCEGQASGEFTVFVPPPVSLAVDFAAVADKCAGPTGMDANLHFEGTGPFKVGYRTLKGSRVIGQKVADFDGADGVIRFRPKDVGEYRYEIVSVEDMYRHINLDANSYSTSQRITELPGAQFLPLATTKLCGTSKLTAEVIVRGRGPFTLKYSIDDAQEFNIGTTGDATDTDRLQLDLDFPSGEHFVRLLSLTDRNQCVTELGARTPNIQVQPHLPHLSWAEGSEHLQSAEPVDLALGLKADSLSYPATLTYEHKTAQAWKGSIHKRVLNGPQDTIRAAAPGTYRLLSLDDGICGGTVDSESQVTISLYERPRLELVADSLPAGVCQNSDTVGKATFTAIGEPPFTIVHESVDVLGRSETKTYQLDDRELTVDLASTLAGQYTHYLWIMDARYPDFPRPHSTVFKHDVWPPSEALFANYRQKVQVCENASLSQAVPVALKGQAPFQVTVQVGNEIKVIAVDSGSRLDLRKELGALDVFGPQKIKILDVVDSHGCKSVPPPAGRGEVDLVVLPQPLVPQPSKIDYCVGEKISFAVTRVDKRRDALLPPDNKFRMEYLWGKKRQHASVGSVFEKYAQQPGNLSLVSVSNSNGCQTVLSEPQLMAQVHPLPRSTITEEPHFSIYKGDHITLGFAFEGTPPFTFKYTRTVNGAVKERKQVKNIMDHVYNITVEDGGVYEIVELQDKFCQSKRRLK